MRNIVLLALSISLVSLSAQAGPWSSCGGYKWVAELRNPNKTCFTAHFYLGPRVDYHNAALKIEMETAVRQNRCPDFQTINRAYGGDSIRADAAALVAKKVFVRIKGVRTQVSCAEVLWRAEESNVSVP